MAQKENKIIAHWSFLAFAQEFGDVIDQQEWTPKEGTPFKTLSFRKDEETTEAKYVHYSSKLGELDEGELNASWKDLQIIQYDVDAETLARRAESGHQLETYILCKKGQIDFGKRIHLKLQ